MIKAILFDMGNVLIFFDPKKSSKAFAEAVGLPEEKIWQIFFISDLERAYTRGEISTEEFFKRVSEYFPKKISFDTFARLWNDIFTENIEMDELLAKLKKHYALYIISNTNELHWKYVCEQFSITRHFTKSFPSHVVGHRKPCQTMFKHVLREIGFKPEETVFVDDVAEFVESAERLGIHGIRFTSCATLEKELHKLGVKF